MKIGLITIHKVLNYGTVLQAFSTQEILKKMGHEVEIIDYITEVRTLKKLLFWTPDSIKKSPVKKSLYILSRFPPNLLKILLFSRFTKKNYNLGTEKYYSIDDLNRKPPKADVYLVGSDQVWNSKYNEMIDRGFFLDFGQMNTKRISYASSFGASEITEDKMSITKKYLEKFNAISVREIDGENIINRMGLESTVVLDPTMMLTFNEWNNYISNKKVKRRYVLLFLLYNEDNGATQYAREIADQKGIEVIQLNWKPFKKEGVDRLAIYKSPFEFLRYVRDAEFIVTNSFHGTAFSLNFNKEFITVSRREFNSRLVSILKLVGLENRYIDGEFKVSSIEQQIDYNYVNEKLDGLREDSFKFLKENIKEG